MTEGEFNRRYETALGGSLGRGLIRPHLLYNTEGDMPRTYLERVLGMGGSSSETIVKN